MRRKDETVTFAEVADAMRRRWFVTVLALAVAAVYALHLSGNGGVYSTRTTVVFSDESPSSFNHLVNLPDETGIIAFAGTVANDVNGGRPVERYARSDAPYYGTGLRKGISVALRDDGGQWATSFPRAELIIQVVGPTREYVASRQREMISRVAQRTRSLQLETRPGGTTVIQTDVVPVTKVIDRIYPSRRDQLLAFAALMASATLVGGWGSIRLDARPSSRGGGITTPPETRSPGMTS